MISRLLATTQGNFNAMRLQNVLISNTYGKGFRQTFIRSASFWATHRESGDIALVNR